MTVDQAREVCAELVADGTFETSDHAAFSLRMRDEIDEIVYAQIISVDAWRLIYA